MADNHWDKWRKESIIENDGILIGMMEQCIRTIDILSEINKVYYAMTIDCLIREWYSLSNIAFNRGIEDYPRLSVNKSC